jgi:hypothetical protein
MLRLFAWILLAAPVSAQVVEGRVINIATGNGIPDVLVRLLAMGQVDYRATTDQTGRFRMEAVKDGSYTVVYSAANFTDKPGGQQNPLLVTAGAGPVQLQYEMAPVSRISGRVLDGAGDPVPNATVEVTQTLQFGEISSPPSPTRRENSRVPIRWSRASGCFRQRRQTVGSRRNLVMGSGLVGRVPSIPA